MARKGVLPEGIALVPLTKGGHERCQFVKHIGKQCEQPAISGRARCRFHGGKSGRPPTHGRSSKYNPVPRGLVEKFEKAMEDPELLSVRKEAALVSAQIWQIAEENQDRESFGPRATKKLLVLIRTQQRLVGQEIDRLVALEQMMTMDKLLLMIANITDIIYKRVADGPTKKQIAEDLRLLIGTRVPNQNEATQVVIENAISNNGRKNGRVVEQD